MASTSAVSAAVLIPTVLILFTIINTVIVTAVRESELSVMFGVLRARGYHLFANAIATSDVHYDLTSDGNFTLFAPINSALFALDMTLPASNYVATVRYHVVPHRYSMIDLLSLPPSSNTVPTLVPGRNVVIEQRRSVRSLISVGGVDITVPGMFYGRDLAVHGLGGILEYRSHRSRNSPVNLTVTGASQTNPTGNLTNPTNPTNLTFRSNASSLQPPPQPPIYNITGNYTFQFPIAIQSPLNPVSSNPKQNQTVISPHTLPTDGGTDTHSTHSIHSSPSPNKAPVHPVSSDFKGEEHRARAKLLEVSSVGSYSLSPDTESTGDPLQEIIPVDDKTLDCLLADDGGDRLNTGGPPRRLDIGSNMVCAQK